MLRQGELRWRSRSHGAISSESLRRPRRSLSPPACHVLFQSVRRPPPRFRMRDQGLLVNDVHSQLNATRVDADRQAADGGRGAAPRCRARAIAGQVGVDRRRPPRHGRAAVRRGQRCSSTCAASIACWRFDAERGAITVEGGIQWPQLHRAPQPRAGRPRSRQWGHLSEADRRRSPEHRRRACRATRTAAAST